MDDEAYKLLAFRVPKLNLPDPTKMEDNWIYYYLRSKTVIERAIKISIKDDQTYTYDRSLLKDKYKKAWHVAYKIISAVPELSKKYGRSTHNKVRKINSIMAYASLLLFINDWDVDASIHMHTVKIASIDEVKNMNLGNVIGINPFVNYSEWHVLKFIEGLKTQLGNFDLNEEFNKAKSEIMAHYLK